MPIPVEKVELGTSSSSLIKNLSDGVPETAVERFGVLSSILKVVLLFSGNPADTSPPDAGTTPSCNVPVLNHQKESSKDHLNIIKAFVLILYGLAIHTNE